MSREQQHWPALRETQPQVLFMSCQWPLPRTWKLCASYVTCSAYLGDKVCWTIMWLGILTFPLSLKISMPDIKHIPFYFNIVYLPKSGYDLKLDPAMSIPWYFVFLYYDERSLTLQLLPCWDFCNVLACEKVLFFFFWHYDFQSGFLSVIINTCYLKAGSSVGLPYSDWRKIRPKVYLNTQDSRHLTRTNKIHQ